MIEVPVNVAGLDRAAVLAALYNNSSAPGLAALHEGPDQITADQARERMAGGETGYNYFWGRYLKVEFEGDLMEGGFYDNFIGSAGSAERVIANLRETGSVGRL